MATIAAFSIDDGTNQTVMGCLAYAFSGSSIDIRCTPAKSGPIRSAAEKEPSFKVVWVLPGMIVAGAFIGWSAAT